MGAKAGMRAKERHDRAKAFGLYRSGLSVVEIAIEMKTQPRTVARLVNEAKEIEKLIESESLD